MIGLPINAKEKDYAGNVVIVLALSVQNAGTIQREVKKMEKAKYIFYPFEVRIFKNWWVFPLAVLITFDDPRYYMDNTFNITVSFLCFHARWGFRKCS